MDSCNGHQTGLPAPTTAFLQLILDTEGEVILFNARQTMRLPCLSPEEKQGPGSPTQPGAAPLVLLFLPGSLRLPVLPGVLPGFLPGVLAAVLPSVLPVLPDVLAGVLVVLDTLQLHSHLWLLY